MIITNETKERFVEMLEKRQIIVIQADFGAKRKTYNFKFIGANEYGKWDFTPLVSEYSCYPKSRNTDIYYLTICALDAASVICSTLCELKKEGIESDFGDGYSQYEKVRDLLVTFYL